MRTKLFLLVALVIIMQQSYGQLKVKSSGNVIIGPDTTWADYNLNITGSGTSGSNGKLGFGDNSSSGSINVLLGEYGSTDTDQLLLHGDQGIYFSTTESISSKMFLNASGKLGLGITSPSANFQIGTNTAANNAITSIGAEFRLCKYSTTNWSYIQARDNTGSYDIGIVFRSQEDGDLVNAMQIEPDGTVKVLTDFIDNSDLRLKSNIRSLSQNEAKGLYDLNAINYIPLGPDSIPSTETSSKRKYGLIAQEVQEIYPDLVYEDSEGYLGLSYRGFIPILVEALKDLQSKVDSLETKLSDEPVYKSGLILDMTTTVSASDTKLYQNVPNPFSQDTEIKFEISSESSNAGLYIYDMQGTQINSYNIPDKGLSSVTIYGSEMNPGMYLYTLIVDGREIDTKRMILTD